LPAFWNPSMGEKPRSPSLSRSSKAKATPPRKTCRHSRLNAKKLFQNVPAPLPPLFKGGRTTANAFFLPPLKRGGRGGNETASQASLKLLWAGLALALLAGC